MDMDEALAYSTQKVVWIRDRWVGSCYYSLILLVLFWVFGGQILWRNEHFLKKDVQGLPRLWYAHPTVDNCDPLHASCKSDYHSLRELPYCNVYSGAVKNEERAHCEYENKLSLVPGGITDNKIFIPTAVEIVTETAQCDPKASNNFTCDNEYRTMPGSDCLKGHDLCSRRGDEEDQFYYVADIKEFKIRFTSSYERDDLRGTSLMLPAFVGVCPSLLRADNWSARTRTWSERQHVLTHERCSSTDLKIRKIPCEFGVDCAQMRNFDIMEDTGVSTVGENVKGKAMGIADTVTGPIGDISQFLGRKRRPEGTSPDARTEAVSGQVPVRGSISAAAASSVTAHTVRLPGPRSPPEAAALADLAIRRRLKRSRAAAEMLQGSTKDPSGSIAPEKVDADQERKKMSMYSDNWGDVFTVGRLLQLAGADLDADHNMDGWTTRQAGTALEVLAVYNNLYPILSTFGYKPVQYHYQVNELLLPYVSRTQLSSVQPKDYPKSRSYEVRYGLLVHFKVSGSFGFFSPVYLILMLTTAFALTATATTVTDGFFLYLSSHQANFFHLKYEVSPDFSDMWECEVCSFCNLDAHATCQGVPKFMCPKTTKVCGAARPPKRASRSASNLEDAAASSA